MEKYRDENGKLWTKEELRKDYAEFLLESPETYDCISFDDYMKDATGKNGALRKVEVLSPTERENLINATKLLQSAFDSFYSAIEKVETDSFNEYLTEKYPFAESFDEAYYTMLFWLENIKETAEDNKLERGHLI